MENSRYLRLNLLCCIRVIDYKLTGVLGSKNRDTDMKKVHSSCFASKEGREINPAIGQFRQRTPSRKEPSEELYLGE
jgi:hypothetical protein